MWNLFLISACLLAQQPQPISGLVVDQQGTPVAEARIDHSGDRMTLHQTDRNGRFELKSVAPVIVIRKPGYSSELVRLSDSSLHITLTKADHAPEFPTCAARQKYVGIAGWSAAFQFPATPGIKARHQSHDIDYGIRFYTVTTPKGRQGVTHGRGPMWSFFGLPSDRTVWQSVKYEESTYESGGRTIVDAKGQLPDGTHWRNLGTFGETASYSNLDAETAKRLDRLLDGACIKSR